jgi:hypothetical protein
MDGCFLMYLIKIKKDKNDYLFIVNTGNQLNKYNIHSDVSKEIKCLFKSLIIIKEYFDNFLSAFSLVKVYQILLFFHFSHSK